MQTWPAIISKSKRGFGVSSYGIKCCKGKFSKLIMFFDINISINFGPTERHIQFTNFALNEKKNDWYEHENFWWHELFLLLLCMVKWNPSIWEVVSLEKMEWVIC